VGGKCNGGSACAASFNGPSRRERRLKKNGRPGSKVRRARTFAPMGSVFMSSGTFREFNKSEISSGGFLLRELASSTKERTRQPPSPPPKKWKRCNLESTVVHTALALTLALKTVSITLIPGIAKSRSELKIQFFSPRLEREKRPRAV
jgi:hypothetical protein